MSDIHVDMFEVQLGAALLLQFKDSQGETVRVLADAGIKASARYPQSHVAQKLKTKLQSSAGSMPPIDLLVGTHYDEDHLAGLIDVAKQFKIGQAILPPVRKPRHPKPGSVSAAALLDTAGLDDAADFPFLIKLNDDEWDEHVRDLEALVDQADAQLRKLRRWEPLADSDDPDEDEIRPPEDEFDVDTERRPTLFKVELAAAQFARIRKSAHKGAIVARWLRDLVIELKKKRVLINALDIASGVPDYFVWDPASRTFVSSLIGLYSASSEPKFTLLGPSRALVAHHAKRLPIGCYLTIAGQIPVKPVTASNQLSYVMLFESANQQLLVCGDAGCVDFWDKKRRAFYPALLQAIKQPHVVQVAHHAGANHRFYHVLLDAGCSYATGLAASLLLLSHAHHDTYRPTNEFNQFVTNLQTAGKNFELLSTSKPDPAKVTAFKHLYCPPIPLPPANVGDVELSYNHGVWIVVQHLVQP